MSTQGHRAADLFAAELPSFHQPPRLYLAFDARLLGGGGAVAATAATSNESSSNSRSSNNNNNNNNNNSIWQQYQAPASSNIVVVSCPSSRLLLLFFSRSCLQTCLTSSYARVVLPALPPRASAPRTPCKVLAQTVLRYGFVNRWPLSNKRTHQRNSTKQAREDRHLRVFNRGPY